MLLKSLKRRIKVAVSLLVWISDSAGSLLFRLFGRRPRPSCVVLYYHSVPAAYRLRFAEQMDTLLRLVRPVPAGHSGALESGAKYAAVTFDDGFVSVLENASPELRQRRIPWTIFVPSGWLGETPGWIRQAHPSARSDRVMTAAELRALIADPLVTVGSHTVGHTHMVEAGPEKAEEELVRSKADLQAVLERPVEQFSYPFGARTPRIDEQARVAGYKRLFGIEPVPAFRDPGEFVTGRVAVDPWDTPLEFRLKVLGCYRWMARNAP